MTTLVLFYDINIRKYEFGTESVWRRKEQSKTTKRLSFVFTCDTVNKKKANRVLLRQLSSCSCRWRNAKSTQSGLLSLNTSKTMLQPSISISWKTNQVMSWSLKTSRMISTSISVLDLPSIGTIVLITGWWIMTLFAYWKGMLDIHHGLMCQQNKGSFVTEITTRMWHFLNGILNRKDTEHVMTRYSDLKYLVYSSEQPIGIFQVGISWMIAFEVGYSSTAKYSNLQYVVVLCLLCKLYVVVYYPLMNKMSW